MSTMKYIDEEGLIYFSQKIKKSIHDAISEAPDLTELMATVASLQSRVQELENQMIVENETSDGANDFSEIEPENSSDSVVTDYE